MKLEKYRERDHKKIGILIFTICCILLIAGVFLYTSYAWYEESENFNLINGTVEDPGDLYFAIYVDDVIASSMPTKNSGYTLDTEKSSCTNGVTVSLDITSWIASADFTNYIEGNSSRTKCTLYFKKRNIQDEIIAELDDSGSCPNVNEDGTVNVTSAESENGYLCSATDDYGTSYYYRGNVTNNYVNFAGFYWRIIRINGDGSIRMIYAGDASVIDALDDSEKEFVMVNGYDYSFTAYTSIGDSAYNSSRDDNAYVGYMYGTVGSSTYEETHANINDSTIKTFIDSWYEANLKGTEYEGYLSDTLFCNDRSLYPGENGTGAGTSDTAYRWAPGPGNGNYPRLTCVQQNDRFTVDDTTLGNGALTYPIGLITMDEASLAGLYNVGNDKCYIASLSYFWSMSPAIFGNEMARAWAPFAAFSSKTVTDKASVRPVLSIKAGSLSFGTGIWNDPYVI